jgi:hypothetical protein
MTYFLFPSEKDKDQVDLPAVLHAVQKLANEPQFADLLGQLEVLVRLD